MLPEPRERHTYYEFFAGGGMARAGLGATWKCLFANDIDEKKAQAYADNWGSDDFVLRDVAQIETDDLKGRADLAWASFPCQDLSLAGNGHGLEAERSGSFWPFWRLIRRLLNEDRAPRTIVLENVYGALTSNKGRDFAALGSALSGAGYRFGALVVDAVHFVPQSRPRLFIVGVHKGLRIPGHLRSSFPNPMWHPRAVEQARWGLSKTALSRWIWWDMPHPGPRRHNFSDLIEADPSGVKWHTEQETLNLLNLMSDINRRKVQQALKAEKRMIGGVYRRTRDGVQRAEVRFDDVAGCLRTPSGGSSRQTIMIIERGKIRSRLLSGREAARLMGLPDSYKLPSHYNTAYHLAGDGLAVPVVRSVAEHILEPLITANATTLPVKRETSGHIAQATAR